MPKPIDRGLHCAKCGAMMILRQNRKGAWFYGCETYPACLHTVDADVDGTPRPEEGKP